MEVERLCLAHRFHAEGSIRPVDDQSSTDRLHRIEHEPPCDPGADVPSRERFEQVEHTVFGGQVIDCQKKPIRNPPLGASLLVG